MTQEKSEPRHGGSQPTDLRRSRWLWLGLVLVAVAGSALSLLYYVQRSSPSPAATSPLTSFGGSEMDPAVSHDGERVAFSWDGGTGGTFQIYVLEVGTNEPIALTSGMEGARYPAWSPDERDIVFLRTHEGGDSDVVVIPATGGSEQILTTVTDTFYVGIDWSPDGAHLAFVDKIEPGDAESIFLFNIEAGSKRRLTEPATAGSGDRAPVFSSDGSYLAFARWWEGERNEIHVLDLEEQRQRRVADFEGQIRGMDWLPDDSALVLSARWRGTRGLWRVDVESGELTRLDYGENAFGVSISRNTGRLVFSQRRRDCNIWRVSGPEAAEPSPPQRFIASTRQDQDARYSPDGGKVALTSDRSGEFQIWVCQGDGTNCSQLTPNGAMASGPRWSPNGESIAFTEMSQGNAEVYIIDLNVGIPFRLTRDDSSDLAWSWSGDGQWVYFMSDRTGQYEVWRTSVLGGLVEQVTLDGGTMPEVSPDDRFVYFMKLTSPRSVWRLSLESHIERLVCEVDVGFRGFSFRNNLITYTVQDAAEGSRIEAFDQDSRQRHVVAALGKDTRFGCFGRHSHSSDGRWTLFTREDGGGADILSVDGFH